MRGGREGMRGGESGNERERGRDGMKARRREKMRGGEKRKRRTGQEKAREEIEGGKFKVHECLLEDKSP